MSYPGRCSVCLAPVTDPNLFVLPEHGFSVLLGTRCGSTSIKKAILRSVGEDDRDPHNSRWLLDRHIEVEGGEIAPGSVILKPLFTFVRHPMSRAVSTWRYLVKGGRYWPHMGCYGITRAATFLKFCQMLDAVPKATGDLHLRPIASTYRRVASDVLGDQVIRLEEIGERWKVVQATSKVQLPDLPRSNESYLAKPDTTACQSIIRRYYADDFEDFGYE